MDIATPVMAGIAATKAIKRITEFAGISVLVLTRQGGKYQIEAITAGAALNGAPANQPARAGIIFRRIVLSSEDNCLRQILISHCRLRFKSHLLILLRLNGY